jgi:hypothetical protein
MTEHRDLPPVHWHGNTFVGAAGTPVGSVTPDQIGQTYRNTTDDSIWMATGFTDSDWVQIFPILVPSGLLLTDQGSSDGTSISNGTTAFQVKLAFAPTGAPFTGTFRLGWSSEFSHTPAGGDTECQVVRTDGGSTVLGYAEEEAQDGDDWNSFSGFIYVVLAAETPTFELQYRTVQALQNGLIRRTRFEFFEVAT